MDVFRRKELKFLLTPQKRSIIEEALAGHMIPDAHGANTISNLYYDTPDYRLIRHSLEHPVYKEKLRLRCYGDVNAGGDVYLELKKKYKGIVYKRRIPLPEAAATAWLTGATPAPENTQISREIDYVLSFYEGLRPACCSIC